MSAPPVRKISETLLDFGEPLLSRLDAVASTNSEMTVRACAKQKEANMFFRQRTAANATLSYLFGCAGHQMAIAVDVVAGDEDWFAGEAEKAGARIVHVIDTHVHADHFSGGPELARRVGAPYHLHDSNRSRVGFDFSPRVTVNGSRPATCWWTGPPGRQRLWRGLVRQAGLDHRLREALQPDAVDVQAGLRRHGDRRYPAVPGGHGSDC